MYQSDIPAVQAILDTLPIGDRSFVNMVFEWPRMMNLQPPSDKGGDEYWRTLAATFEGEIGLRPEWFSLPVDSSAGNPGQREILVHEVGHTIAGSIPDHLVQEWISIHAAGNPPTLYASVDANEDFAESYRIHRIGGIDSSSQAAGRQSVLDDRRKRFFAKVDAFLAPSLFRRDLPTKYVWSTTPWKRNPK